MRRFFVFYVLLLVVIFVSVISMEKKPYAILHYAEILFVLGSLFYFIQVVFKMIQKYRMSKKQKDDKRA
jgi:hypothetical protein